MIARQRSSSSGARLHEFIEADDYPVLRPVMAEEFEVARVEDAEEIVPGDAAQILVVVAARLVEIDAQDLDCAEAGTGSPAFR